LKFVKKIARAGEITTRSNRPNLLTDKRTHRGPGIWHYQGCSVRQSTSGLLAGPLMRHADVSRTVEGITAKRGYHDSSGAATHLFEAYRDENDILQDELVHSNSLEKKHDDTGAHTLSTGSLRDFVPQRRQSRGN